MVYQEENVLHQMQMQPIAPALSLGLPLPKLKYCHIQNESNFTVFTFLLFTYTSREPFTPVPPFPSGSVNLIVTPAPVVFMVHSTDEPLPGSPT